MPEEDAKKTKLAKKTNDEVDEGGVVGGEKKNCHRRWRRLTTTTKVAFCFFYLLTIATWFSSLLPNVAANPEAKRLYDDLLSNYNRLIRPVGNNSDRLTVKMGLRLSQLIDIVSNFFFFLFQ